MAKDVTATHPDYDRASPDWQLVNDAVDGERAVRLRGSEYLPKPNPSDTSAENAARFEQYAKRAVFYNVTGRTVSTLTGLAFQKWPAVELPTAMDAFKDDVTGSGIPLVQHSYSTLNWVLKNGRGGLLVDYPKTGGNQSRKDEVSGAVQPTITFYDALSITNWRTIKVKSKVLLSLVVLRETRMIEDGFAVKEETQYRVLKLEQIGVRLVYVVELHVKRKLATSNMEEWVIEESFMPTDGAGTPWDEIPFKFVGAVNNDTAIDSPPMRDIASLNIAHYRNSADYEEGVYTLGQPQIWVTGVDETWIETWKKNGIYFGSRAIGAGPTGANVQLLQAQANSMASEAMDKKEKQMAALGARLLTPTETTRTAREVGSDDRTAHSVLSLACDNVSLAYEQALAWAARFANIDGDIEFSIPTDFGGEKVDAQMLTAMLGAVMSGKMPETDFWSWLREAGFIDSSKDDDAIREELANQAPPASGGALDDDLEDDDPEEQPNQEAA